jgi:hypothetical protein
MISKISTVGMVIAAIVLMTTSQAIAQAPSVFTIASRIIKDFAGKKVPSLIKEAARKTPEIVASATAEAVVAHQLFGKSEVGTDDIKALLKKFEESRRTEEELLKGYYDLRVALQEVLVTPPPQTFVQAPVDPCAEAPTHWRSAEAIGAAPAYKDHLQRFANCSFALLAVVRIAELESARPQPALCANATTHWDNARAINTVGAYQDHLNRFPLENGLPI